MRSIQFLVALQYTFTSLHFLCCSAFTPPLLARIKCQQTHPSPTCLFSSLSIDSSSKTLTKNGNNSPPEKEGDDDDDDDPLDIIRYHTELAINQRGQPKCLEALQQLAALSQRRISYDFANNSPAENNVGTVVSPLRQLLPPNIIHKFLKQVQKMEDHGWLSTNPDSVDGLPSLHLNLVSGGKPIVPSMMMDGGGDNELDDEFQLGIQQLLQIVHSPIYNSLLPKVHRLMNSTSIRISDVFLRRYGQDVCGDWTRNGISAHYDVYSRVTAVMALDDVASQGTNGLFTTHVSYHSKNGGGGRGAKTSNHAALRRFFPLDRGDCVVHTWDVLHGVDVEPGIDRTSLIVWFTEGDDDDDDDDDEAAISPWLRNHPNLETDDVLQFVLASALSSASDESGLGDSAAEESSKDDISVHELYLRSAAQGNSFAMTRMGSLFEGGSLTNNTHLEEEAMRVLEELRPSWKLPDPIRLQNAAKSENYKKHVAIAMRFWLEGAVRGNPLAQSALADELMLQASISGEEDARLLAAVFFALAAQQGVEEASDSLSRVIDYDLSSRGVETEEDFLASPVVKIAQAALLSI